MASLWHGQETVPPLPTTGLPEPRNRHATLRARGDLRSRQVAWSGDHATTCLAPRSLVLRTSAHELAALTSPGFPWAAEPSGRGGGCGRPRRTGHRRGRAVRVQGP